MKAGKVIQEILEERVRQVGEEGWSTEHDDGHTDWSLSRVAACYILAITRCHTTPYWPRSWDISWFKFDSKNPRRALIKAGALIVAEIERLDRHEARLGGSK